MSFSNYQNPFSILQIPVKANRIEFVPIEPTSLDTNDFVLAAGDATKLQCVNPGSWLFMSQYQLVGLKNVKKAKYGRVNGFYRLNGVNVPNSDAFASVVDKDGAAVLVICLAITLKVGDIVQFAVESTAKCSKPNVVCKDISGEELGTGDNAPSVIFTITKVPAV